MAVGPCFPSSGTSGIRLVCFVVSVLFGAHFGGLPSALSVSVYINFPLLQRKHFLGLLVWLKNLYVATAIKYVLKRFFVVIFQISKVPLFLAFSVNNVVRFVGYFQFQKGVRDTKTTGFQRNFSENNSFSSKGVRDFQALSRPLVRFLDIRNGK